ncbi:MucR family transcriptional regulator [Methylobacterium organophilum]|uniref:Transcriptional regulatory protein ros n=1 Tax=Methylobacterium organophilum TaxID=410 RepID=A0ABQ4TGV8_METOR|nr:MucR family transcriptional regulator [Methylobacterium organophilum]UMY17341.1 MucR family transcriptional regulator [Methylobacterium organophilum]GJE29272.1 Transcriptional regulatory protein ros [Methylobacterium organophilum]
MTEENQEFTKDFVALAGDIVSAYVSNNSMPAAELPALILNIHSALLGLAGPAAPAPVAAEAVEKPSPAQIRKSVTPDAIISFIDGKPYKTLKRHLGTHGLDPYSYRQKFGLPSDYPMVAPNYAAQRSALAKSIGLGRPGGRLPEEEPVVVEPAPKGRRKSS